MDQLSFDSRKLGSLSLLAHSPGIFQVIAFLNDAFMSFDEVIARHDAYKVETTGETYMVASGVPNENGGRHIFEVAEIALELREVGIF